MSQTVPAVRLVPAAPSKRKPVYSPALCRPGSTSASINTVAVLAMAQTCRQTPTSPRDLRTVTETINGLTGSVGVSIREPLAHRSLGFLLVTQELTTGECLSFRSFRCPSLPIARETRLFI